MNLFNTKKKELNLIEYTPKDSIASFIELPKGVNGIEAMWHTASVALDTEKIRFVYSFADGGVYFIAAPALSFTKHPHSSTSLASSLPNFNGHKGNGAYFSMLSNNSYCVIVKNDKQLESYIGTKENTILFAKDNPQFWTTASSPWIGLEEFSLKKTLKLMSDISIGILVAIFFLSVLSGFFKYKQEQFLNLIKEKEKIIVQKEQRNLLVLNNTKENSFDNKILNRYLEISNFIITENGRLLNFDYQDGKLKYSIELPITTTDFSLFNKNSKYSKTEDLIIIENEELIK